MTTESPLTTALHYDAAQHYSCEQCPARCCRFPWAIDITDEEIARFQAVPWIQERLTAFGAEFTLSDGKGLMPTVTLWDGKPGCVFLDEDDRCLMHKREGHEFLSRTCQVYPFAFLRAGQEVYAAPSYFCKSILENCGEPFASQIHARFERHTAFQLIMDLPETIQLASLTLDRAAYGAFADWLLGLLKDPSLPVTGALRQARILLREILLAYAGQTTLSKADLESAIAKLPPIAELPAPSGEAPNMSTRVILALRLLPATKDFVNYFARIRPVSGWRSTLDKLSLLDVLVRGDRQVTFWDKDRPVAMRDAARVRVVLDADMQAEIRRYLVYLLETRKVFTSYPNLMTILLIMVGSYPAIIRMARYLALHDERTEVTIQDIRDAVGYVDVAFPNKPKDRNFWAGAQRVILELLSSIEDVQDRLLGCEGEMIAVPDSV